MAAPRWTWKRITEALVAKGYACGVRTMNGRRVYEIFNLDPYGPRNEVDQFLGGFRSRFDTVEEVRDSFGFGKDEGGAPA